MVPRSPRGLGGDSPPALMEVGDGGPFLCRVPHPGSQASGSRPLEQSLSCSWGTLGPWFTPFGGAPGLGIPCDPACRLHPSSLLFKMHL